MSCPDLQINPRNSSTGCGRPAGTASTATTRKRPSCTGAFASFGSTPRRLDEDDIRAFLTPLASDRNVAASPQNQALNALIFLYEQVLGLEIGDIGPLDTLSLE